MLQFEKPDTQIDKSLPPYAYSLPNMAVVLEFEECLQKFIA